MLQLQAIYFRCARGAAGYFGFYLFEGTRITSSISDIVVGKPTLVGQALGAGTVAFDDLSIKEFDASKWGRRAII